MFVNRGGRHPHEAALLVVCVLSGVAGLLAFERIASPTVRTLPVVVAYMWFATMAVGGLITLTGLFLPLSGIKGPLVERSGLLILAAIWYGYGLVVLASAGLQGLVFCLVVSGFATANMVRALVGIPADIKAMVAAAALTHTVDELGGEEP